ncbi:hypothetical protein scyTo_0012164 [Scyliorhinus torazame]|uniref:Uncharacterized protein n=1 Tax=Scyliorhinus torazame TaxID=75743 RepID=A0A401P3C5_SCYTO|nr:hypothetical protein [Scyliorhinus torazame]
MVSGSGFRAGGDGRAGGTRHRLPVSACRPPPNNGGNGVSGPDRIKSNRARRREQVKSILSHYGKCC